MLIRRALIIVMAGLLLAAAFACQDGERPQADLQSDDAELMRPFAPHPETVTISVARELNLGNVLADGVTTSDNIYFDVIRDKLNVQVVIDWETTPDDYQRKLALAIANDTLPDVFFLQMSEYPTFKKLVENGKLADLTEAYEHCIGGYDAMFLSLMDGSQNDLATFDGRLMGIPLIPTGYNFNLLWVRKDWLDLLDMPVPRTLAEIEATAASFMENELGGPYTQGIVVDPNAVLDSSSSFLSLSTVAHAFGAYPSEWITGPDGNVVYGSIMPGIKQTLAFLNGWYQAGILDRRFMTYPDMNAVTPAIRENRVGMFFGAYWSPYIVGYDKLDNEKNWVPVLAPVDGSGLFNHTNTSNPTAFLVVSSKCESPAAAIKAINVAFELQRGAYNDDPVIKAEVDRLLAANSFGRTINPFPGSLSAMFDEEARRGLSYMQYIETGFLDPVPGLPIESIKEEAEKVFAWHYSSRTYKTDTDVENRILFDTFQTIAHLYNYENRHEQPIAFSGHTESMGEYWPALNEMEKQAFIRIITGEMPLDFFDEFVIMWKNSGGELITAEIQEILDG